MKPSSEKTELGPNQYRCAFCEGVYTKGRSDEEADAEYKDRFSPEEREDGKCVVCDDCYKQMGFK